jgi:hypothetical protein
MTPLEWRKLHRLTQSQAGIAIGMSRSQWRRYEDAPDDVPKVVRMALAYLDEHPGEIPRTVRVRFAAVGPQEGRTEASE